MNKNFYSEQDQKGKEITDVLKQLPHITAPENFEYNLMTRIENKNFGVERDNKKYTLFGFFKPAIAVIASAVIVFFVMDYQNNNFENPLMSDPQVRSTDAQSTSIFNSAKEFVVNEKSDTNSSQAGKDLLKPNNFVVVVKENDVVSEQKGVFPFPDKSFDLDAKMRTRNNTAGDQSRVLAGTGNNRVQFDGFFPRIPNNKRIIDSLRGLDSIAQAKRAIPDPMKK